MLAISHCIKAPNVIIKSKVTFEVPSPSDGIIHPVGKPGGTYSVDQTVGFLAKNRKEHERIVKDHPAEPFEPAETALTEEEAITVKPVHFEDVEKRGPWIKASPLARSMASAHGMSLAHIKGTGPGGRIIKRDILQTLKGEKALIERKTSRPVTSDKDFQGKETLETIPIRGVRRVIFDNMTLSLNQTAQLTLHTDALGEALVDLRHRLSSRLGEDRVKISYNAILIKIVASALRLHPKMNVSAEGDEIKVWRQVHVGVAMEAEDALLVPVIRNPDLKTILEINRELNDLILKTKNNRLLPDDLSNGTFTITNLGFADIDYFTPILRPPESALLGVGRIVEKPVVKNDHVIPGLLMGLSLTFDHRIIDGAPAARFLKTVKEIIEAPVLLLS